MRRLHLRCTVRAENTGGTPVRDGKRRRSILLAINGDCLPCHVVVLAAWYKSAKHALHLYLRREWRRQ